MAASFADPDQNLLAVVQGMPGSVALLDRDICFVEVNARFERDLGLPREEVIGRSYFDLSPAAVQWRGAFEQCLAGRMIKGDRVRVLDPRGVPVLYQSANIPWRDASGAVTGFLIASQRLSNSDEDSDLALASERLEDAVELAGIHVWEMNYEAKSLWSAGAADTFFEGALGYEDLEADESIAIHPDDRDRIRASWAEQASRGGDRHAEYRLDRSDKLVWVASGLRTSYGADGAPKRMLGVLQDITDRKLAELAVLKANEAKSTFLATMSHEIRTPLNGVLGMAQAMEVGTLTDEQRERLQIIRQSGESLLTILNDILDLSKVEAGKLELESIPFDFGAVARSAQAPFTAQAGAKGVTLRCDIEAAEGVYEGDPTRLRQILYNFTSNALKFTEKGEVALAARRLDDGLELRVSDTGLGIPADKLAALFDSFSQVDASTTRKFGGTGLGLSICRQLTQLMGGEIRVESEPGQGSAFIVALPLPYLGAQIEAADDSDAPEGAAQGLSNFRVLAAEDNSINQLVLKTLLQQIGVQPHMVDDGAQALAAWEAAPWDLILMDVQMPVMDGLEATRAIRHREHASGRARTPILALTANAMSHQIAEYRAAGMDDHVAKPIEAIQLFNAVANRLATVSAAEDALIPTITATRLTS